jgi:hypothetical protein
MVVHELEKPCSAPRIPFVNWLLQNVHEGVLDPRLLFIYNEAWFYFSDGNTQNL